MAVTDDLTTLVCLFHRHDHALAARKDLLDAGVQQPSITLMDLSEAQPASSAGTFLQELGVPERDQKHLLHGLQEGGSIVAVRATRTHVNTVEQIFSKHQASKIDEAVTDDREPMAATGVAANRGVTAIPVVEEELVVGKRTVDEGGVRLFRRVVEVPVTESVNLREEHVHVERRPVDRAATEDDLAAAGDRTIELTETAEEAVISKNARVVEEVLVGKEVRERTEHVRDTVRKTEVEVEQITPGQQTRGDRTR